MKWMKLFREPMSPFKHTPTPKYVKPEPSSGDNWTTHEELKKRKRFCDDIKEQIAKRKKYHENINKDGYYDG